MHAGSTHARTSAARRDGLRRALAAEARRLRGDPVPWLFLPVTLLSAVSLLAGLPADIRAAPAAVIDALGAAMSGGLLGGLLVGAAVLCAFGPTFAERTGVRAREQLFVSTAATLTARAATSVLTAAVYVAVGTAVLQAVFLGATGRMLVPAELFARVLVAAVLAGLWGYLLGVVLRNPILVLFVVPATLMPAMLLVEPAPDLAQALPLPALLAVAGAFPEGLDLPLALLLATVWIGVLAAATAVLEHRRDRL